MTSEVSFGEAPLIIPEHAKHLCSRLKHDFFLAFYLSQGVSTGQVPIYEALGMDYAASLPPTRLIAYPN